MRYYQHHIGDFNNATRHLTRVERSIYRDLIEFYYDIEYQLPLDISEICRKILATDEATTVERMLNEFFTKTPDGWYHDRCELEIEKYLLSNNQKSEAGRASAAKRALKKQRALNGSSTTVEIPLNGNATEEQLTTNHEPLTTNHEPDTEKQAGCPYQSIVDLYHEILPMCPEVRLLTKTRKSYLKARWDSDKNRQTLDYWRNFFEYVSGSLFLTGKTPPSNGRDKPFIADFEWLITESNFAKVIERKYK